MNADDRARVIDALTTWFENELTHEAFTDKTNEELAESAAAALPTPAPEAAPDNRSTGGPTDWEGRRKSTDRRPSHQPAPPLTADKLVALLTDEQRAAVETAQRMTTLTLLMVVGKVKAEALTRRGAADQATLAAVRAVCAKPDDTQWWPVQPYTDPHDDDEVVEVHVVNVARIIDLLDGPDAGGGRRG